MGDDIKIPGTPEAIAVDANGKVYVTDYSLGRMQVFDTDGNFLWALSGKSISSNPLSRPTGIAFDANGQILIVNQSGNSVKVFKLP
jgi:DNA-binding beta-propeller fold protein YncE